MTKEDEEIILKALQSGDREFEYFINWEGDVYLEDLE